MSFHNFPSTNFGRDCQSKKSIIKDKGENINFVLKFGLLLHLLFFESLGTFWWTCGKGRGELLYFIPRCCPHIVASNEQSQGEQPCPIISNGNTNQTLQSAIRNPVSNELSSFCTRHDGEVSASMTQQSSWFEWHWLAVRKSLKQAAGTDEFEKKYI